MLWIAAVPVEHRGNLAGAPGATGGALAELGALLGGQANLGHDGLLNKCEAHTPGGRDAGLAAPAAESDARASRSGTGALRATPPRRSRRALDSPSPRQPIKCRRPVYRLVTRAGHTGHRGATHRARGRDTPGTGALGVA